MTNEQTAEALIYALCESLETQNAGDTEFERGMRTAAKRIRKEFGAAERAAPAEPMDRDAVALARYKVVPAHESMFHRFAVVAGDGKQQLYLGREVECQNMARKFAGAFLDGAFYRAHAAAPQPPAPQEPADALPTYTDDLELRYAEACEERDHLRELLKKPPTPAATADALDAALDAFEQKQRGIPQAHIAAALVAELRAALAAQRGAA